MWGGIGRPGARTTEQKTEESETARPVRQAAIVFATTAIVLNTVSLSLWLWDSSFGIVRYFLRNPRHYVVVMILVPLVRAAIDLCSRMRQEIHDPGFDSPNKMIARPTPLTPIVRLIYSYLFFKERMWKGSGDRGGWGGFGASDEKEKK